MWFNLKDQTVLLTWTFKINIYLVLFEKLFKINHVAQNF